MRRITTGLLALVVTVAAADRVAAQTGRDLFQQALVKERAEGDLHSAIALYERVVAEFAADRQLAASALLQLGQCYEKLGSTDAEQAYQRVVQEFADQTELVTLARLRLRTLRPAAAANQGPVARRALTLAETRDALPEMEPSPDGRLVAYVSTSDGGIYVRDVASGEVRQLVPGLPATWNYSPTWSADAEQLAFSTQDQRTKIMTVRIVHLASGDVDDVPGTRVEGWVDVEDWSRDGRHLLCNTGDDQIALIAVDDGSRQVLSDSAYMGNGALSPDGRFVAYAVGTEGDAQVVLRPATGGVGRQVTSAPGGNYRPQWAPDGRAIAWQGPSGIWVMPLVEGEPRGTGRLAVSANRIMVRRWTPGGLYYSQFTDAGQRSVPYQVRMDPGTGRPAVGDVQMLSGGRPDSVTAFAWSPDMNRIAFGHRLSPEIAITTVNPRSTVTWDLGRQGHPLRTLRWSSDGRAILYEAELSFWRSEGSTVMVLDPETGQVKELFPRMHNVAGLSLSGDGRGMTFYRFGVRDSGSAPTWPSGGSGIWAVVVASTGQGDGLVVARVDSPTDVPFSSTVPPSISLQGDHVLFVRQGVVTDSRSLTPDAASLWVVGSDGTGTRRLATAAFIQSAIWDPAGKFIAYTAKPEMADGSTVLRVVDVATGAEQEIALPDHVRQTRGAFAYVRLTNWSPDGGVLGMVIGKDFDSAWEYWVVQGLQEEGR